MLRRTGAVLLAVMGLAVLGGAEIWGQTALRFCIAGVLWGLAGIAAQETKKTARVVGTPAQSAQIKIFTYTLYHNERRETSDRRYI